MVEIEEQSETGRIEAFSDGVFAIAFNRLWKHASTADRLLAQKADLQEVDAITKQA